MVIVYRVFTIPRLKYLEEQINKLSLDGWKIACPIGDKALLLKKKVNFDGYKKELMER